MHHHIELTKHSDLTKTHQRARGQKLFKSGALCKMFYILYNTQWCT